jgi:hypothetical protein
LRVAQHHVRAVNDPLTDSHGCCELERRIVGTPAPTAQGLAGKRCIIGKTDFVATDDYDMAMLVEQTAQ